MIMKKKRIVLVLLIFALSVPLTVFGKIEHGFSQGSYKLQRDGSYKLYQTYHKEDGTMARNEWIQASDDYNAVGVSYFEYYGDDKNVMSNATTPDGYLVNDEAHWYKNCPLASITETEGSRIEHNGAVFFPFSYDGNVAKNDYLGINLNYNETDYQEGFELYMRNYTCASSYAVFTITSPTKATAKVSIFPYDASTDGAIQSWVQDEQFTKSPDRAIVYNEKTIGGKTLRGYKIISTYKDSSEKRDASSISNSLLAFSESENITTLYTSRLYSPIPGGASWGIEFDYKEPDEEALLINWLNTHMTVTK